LQSLQDVNSDVISSDVIKNNDYHLLQSSCGNGEPRKEQVQCGRAHQILRKAGLDVCGLLEQIFAVPWQFVCRNGREKGV